MDTEHMDALCGLYTKILDATNAQVSNGLDSVDTHELSEAVDMIKDLAEAKKDCYKACYYKTVTEAMEQSAQLGYREKVYPRYDESYFPDDRTSDEIARHWRMGYHENVEPRMYRNGDRYGLAYEEYKEARKHYTETKSETDKEEMDMHIREHLSDTLSTVMDMYRAADPDLRKRIKADIAKLAADMT